MKVLLIGASLLALTVPGMANAQTSARPTGAPVASEVAQGRYLVFFDLGRAELTSEARRVVAEAAESYRQTGRARVDVTGYTDTSGSPARNQRLSEQRAQAVEVELVQQGVPASSITVSGRGQNDLLVPTADGVRQPENRRVEIVVTQPEPAPVAVAPEPVEPPPPPPEPEPDHFLFALGPVYGHNFGEDDADGGDKTQSDMAGVELTFNALPGFLGGVSLKQMALWSLNSTDDGARRPQRGQPRLRAGSRHLPSRAQRQFRRHLRQRRAEWVRGRPGDRLRRDLDQGVHRRPEGGLRLPVPQRRLGRGHRLGRPGSWHPLLSRRGRVSSHAAPDPSR